MCVILPSGDSIAQFYFLPILLIIGRCIKLSLSLYHLSFAIVIELQLSSSKMYMHIAHCANCLDDVERLQSESLCQMSTLSILVHLTWRILEKRGGDGLQFRVMSSSYVGLVFPLQILEIVIRT